MSDEKQTIKTKDQLREERERKVADLLPDEDKMVGELDGRLLMRLFGFVKPYRSELIRAVIFMTVASLLSVAGPWLIGRAVDDGIRAGSVSQLRMWTVLFAAAALVEWITNRARIAIMARVGTGAVADIRSTLFRHLHRLSLNFHINYSVGRMMSRLLGDVTVMRDFITWSITGLFRSFFGLAGIVVAMLFMNWRLALISFAVLPIMAIVTNYWRKHVRTAYRAARARSSLLTGYLNETISGIRVTKSFTREEENFNHFRMLNESYYDANRRAGFLTGLFFPSVDFMGDLSAALVVAFGGQWVLDGALTAGELIAFVLYVQRFFDPIRELAQRYNIFQATMASSERIFRLLDTEPDLQDADDAVTLPYIEGTVRFEHVDFAYKEDEPVLHDINLVARPGEQIALVGETGAGKSTMIRLLARFFDVTGGAIKIDGYDLREVTRESLRRQMGVVLQDTFLFSGTILDNIRYGRLDAGDEETIAAAEAVGADEFINKLPDGFYTEVGENGVNMSVGQRQILSFARALLADPRILVLDEATSSVDTTTEKQIQAALDKLLNGRTSFVIAHRLNTIVNSDKIVVLDQGHIVEMGSHRELLDKQGRYYDLYTMQWAADDETSTATEKSNGRANGHTNGRQQTNEKNQRPIAEVKPSLN